MEGRRPTPQDIEQHLEKNTYLRLAPHSAQEVSTGNHLIFKGVREQNGQSVCIRMVNPKSHRRNDFVTMREEYELLSDLASNEHFPKVYGFVHATDFPPYLVLEWMEGKSFNDLKPLRDEHIRACTDAIARVNTAPLSSSVRELITGRDFLSYYLSDSYWGSVLNWAKRLTECVVWSFPDSEVLDWVLKITPLVRKASRVIIRTDRLFRGKPRTFHLDGAHCGNIFLHEDGRVVFLDAWEKVSFRRDPCFTLVRFLTSTGAKGEIVPAHVGIAVEEYLRITFPMYSSVQFQQLVRVRILERLVADLIWVVWDHVRRKDRSSVTGATSVLERYESAQKLLASF